MLTITSFSVCKYGKNRQIWLKMNLVSDFFPRLFFILFISKIYECLSENSFLNHLFSYHTKIDDEKQWLECFEKIFCPYTNFALVIVFLLRKQVNFEKVDIIILILLVFTNSICFLCFS